jgi:hypothetical protein
MYYGGKLFFGGVAWCLSGALLILELFGNVGGF